MGPFLSRGRLRTLVCFAGFCFVLPATLLPWLVPFLSSYTIGLDYPLFSIAWQQELFFSLRSGTWPLYSPGFAGGQSASALSQGQLYHPVAHLVTLLPGYWQGHALDWNTAARLFTLGWTHWVLFRFLRRLRFGPWLAFFLSASTAYNLRALDMFRFGAAFEAWTGHLLLCCSLGLLCLGASRPRGPLWVVAASYWLAVSGQPQMAYYGFAGAFVFALLCPFWLTSLGVRSRPSWATLRRFWAEAFFWTLVGVLLAAPFWLPYAVEFLPRNVGRVGQVYEWAAAPAYTGPPVGVLEALLRPLRSSVHGSFAGSPLFLLSLSLPAARLIGQRIPRPIWTAWCLSVLVLLFAMGKSTPVFRLAWSTLPFMSSMRIPGRATLVLPMLFLVVSTWLLRPCAPIRSLYKTPATWACACSLFCLLGRALLAEPFVSAAAPLEIRDVPAWLETSLLALACLILVGTACYAVARRDRLLAVPNALLLLYLGLLLGHGTWIARRSPTATWKDFSSAKASDPRAFVLAGLGLYTAKAKEQYERGFLEPYLARVATRAIRVDSSRRALEAMQVELEPDLVYLVSPPAPSVSSSDSSSKRSSALGVETVFASTNELVFLVRSPVPAYLLVGLLLEPNWRVQVDGRPVVALEANGHQIAVPIPAGRSHVHLRYRSPASLAGFGVGALVFFLLGVYVLGRLRLPRGRHRLGLIGLAFVTSIPFVVRLQGGTGWNCKYRWEPSDGPLRNLAYGKRTRPSAAPLPIEEPHLVAPSRAVDGYVGFFGSITLSDGSPYLEIDLVRPRRIQRLRIHEGDLTGVHSLAPLAVNSRPLVVSGSKDGVHYEALLRVENAAALPGWEVRLPRPQTIRYLRIAATGPGCLALREVLVFPD
ncbi:MAG: hypothetical protein D6731_00020 [Planctomycetota bacterium]|nr:MAG: hypothetical protein D6731_00020 [Planctomycetota bacterium]